MNQKENGEEKKKSEPGIGQALLKERKIFLTRDIDAKIANVIMKQLFYLEMQDPEKDIYFYINSPGGEVTSGMAIFDTMQIIKPPVVTIVAGLAASMASVLLAGGAKGRRQAFPNSRVLIHQPLGGVRGAATDIEIHAREILKVKARLNGLLSRLSNQPLERIERDTNRDFWFNSEEAKAYGLVDEILPSQAGKAS